MAIESFDLSEYDLVISTSHCVARGAITRSHTFPLDCCIHQFDMPGILVKFIKLALNHVGWCLVVTYLYYLRIWDIAAVNRVDHYTCNARNVARRIKKIYDQILSDLSSQWILIRVSQLVISVRDIFL